MQAKRIQVNEANLGVGGAVNVTLATPVDSREETNMHNIWGSVSVEPETAAANCQGTWRLLHVDDPAKAILAGTDANINGEFDNFITIACGVFSASNETPYNSGAIHPKSSRNLRPGGRLILQCTVTGITADLASSRVMLCAHTVRK